MSPSISRVLCPNYYLLPQLLALTNGKTLQSAACDEAQLQQIFGVDNPATLHEMRQELCNLTGDDFASIARVLATQIDLNKLLPLVA